MKLWSFGVGCYTATSARNKKLPQKQGTRNSWAPWCDNQLAQNREKWGSRNEKCQVYARLWELQKIIMFPGIFYVWKQDMCHFLTCSFFGWDEVEGAKEEPKLSQSAFTLIQLIHIWNMGYPPPQHALAQRELCFWSLRSPKHLMSLYVPHFPLFIHIIIRKRSCFQLLENERRIPLWSNLPSHQLPLLGSCRERREGQRLNCLCFHLEENFCALLSQANGALAKLIFRLVNSGTAGLTILTVGGWKGQCRPWHKTKDKVRNS